VAIKLSASRSLAWQANASLSFVACWLLVVGVGVAGCLGAIDWSLLARLLIQAVRTFAAERTVSRLSVAHLFIIDRTH